MAKRKKYEFKPDPKGTNFFKRLYVTRLQRKQILKWGLYAVLCVLLLVIQDVLMSQFRLSGATTDLVAAAILLISVYEGTEDGSVFCLIASTIYWFSGSAPGPYVITLMVFLTVGATLFRQSFWHRGFSSITLCAGISLFAYEMLLFLVGMFMGLTIWARAGVFFLTALLSCVVMLALYPAVNAIAKIGGDTWKE